MELKYSTTNCKNYDYYNSTVKRCKFNYDYCGNCHLNKPVQKLKFKKVVKEIPNQKLIITYNWLREQKACQDEIDAFVNEFGKEAEYDKVIKKIEYHLSMSFGIHCDKSWINWLKERKHLLENKNNCEYVTIDNIDVYNKIYIMQNKKSNLIYKLIYSCYSPHFQFISLNKNERINYDNLIDSLIEENIYEFDSFDDFLDWYEENKK